VRSRRIGKHDAGCAAAAWLMGQGNEGRGILGVMQFEDG
jgi:hypothetical protein